MIVKKWMPTLVRSIRNNQCGGKWRKHARALPFAGKVRLNTDSSLKKRMRAFRRPETQEFA